MKQIQRDKRAPGEDVIGVREDQDPPIFRRELLRGKHMVMVESDGHGGVRSVRIVRPLGDE